MKPLSPNRSESDEILRWQRQFFNYLRSPQRDPLTFGVRGEAVKVRRRRADVYRYDWPGRISAALRPDFETLQRRFGKKRFEAYVEGFSAGIPSRRVSLFEISDDFIDYLRRVRADAAYVQQAEWDLAETKAHFAAAHPPPTVPLRTESRLRWASHVQVAGPYLFYRLEGCVKRVKVPSSQVTAVKKLQKGTSILALSRTLEKEGVPASQIGRWFRRWSEHGLLTWN